MFFPQEGRLIYVSQVGAGWGWVRVRVGLESQICFKLKRVTGMQIKGRGEGGKKSNFISHQISAVTNATFLLLWVTDQILLRETLFLGWKILIGI